MNNCNERERAAKNDKRTPLNYLLRGESEGERERERWGGGYSGLAKMEANVLKIRQNQLMTNASH
jgi:hypothetical protein